MLLTLAWLQENISAYMIPQQYYIVSQAATIGTANMMNCLGIIIHDKRTDYGALAHVEAQSTAEAYLEAIGTFFTRMLADLDKLSGSSNSQLEVVLAGNGGGADMSDGIASVITNIAGLRLPSPSIADNRSRITEANAVGRGTRLVGGAMAGAVVYDPSTQKVYFDSTGAKIKGTEPEAKGVVNVVRLQK